MTLRRALLRPRDLFILLGILWLSGCSATTPNIHTYRGKWLLINYWASWCDACMTEMPALDILYQQHKDRLMVVGVSFDSLTDDTLQKFSKQFRVHYPLLAKAFVQSLGVKEISVLPTTLVIDPQGRWVKTLVGPQSSRQFARAVGLEKSASAP